MKNALKTINNILDIDEIEKEVRHRVESSPTATIIKAIHRQWEWDVSGNFWTNDTGYIWIHWRNPKFDIRAKMQGGTVVFNGDSHSSWTPDLKQALIDARVSSEIYHYKLKEKRLKG